MTQTDPQHQPIPYRGRIAPSPTGLLHLGHAKTFQRARQRADENAGTLLLRIEDLDQPRCRPEFVSALYQDMRWAGLTWEEGPDCGGDFGPYVQSQRRAHYLAAWRKLLAKGLIYPCYCSRRDILQSATAPHPEDEEPIYPGTCRPAPSAPRSQVAVRTLLLPPTAHSAVATQADPDGLTWRFRVPDGRAMIFNDGRLGPQSAIAGESFGDFIVWRKDDTPAYQLAVVADDAAMQITEVVRGEDLLVSTFRQLLLYEALELAPPAFFHCTLVRDEHGVRLAKRHAALSLRELRERGENAIQLLGAS